MSKDFVITDDTFCVWPDGDWCRFEDIQEYSWKSDDYRLQEEHPEPDAFDDHTDYTWDEGTEWPEPLQLELPLH